MEVKVCSRCKEEKVVDEFSRDKSRKDGYNSQCKECCKRYREEVKEKINERRAKYREHHNQYIERNADKIKERAEKRRAEFAEKYKVSLEDHDRERRIVYARRRILWSKVS